MIISNFPKEMSLCPSSINISVFKQNHLSHWRYNPKYLLQRFPLATLASFPFLLDTQAQQFLSPWRRQGHRVILANALQEEMQPVWDSMDRFHIRTTTWTFYWDRRTTLAESGSLSHDMGVNSVQLFPKFQISFVWEIKMSLCACVCVPLSFWLVLFDCINCGISWPISTNRSSF